METEGEPGTDRRRRSDRRRSRESGFGGFERRESSNSRRLHLTTAPTRGNKGAAAPVYQLLPAKGYRYLTPLRVVARIASEFAYMEADDSEGCRQVEAMVRELRRNRRDRQRGILGERLARLEKNKHKAVFLRFGDDPGSETEYLCATVIPGEPLTIECDSPAHASAAEPLLKRCAKALEYSILLASADDR